MVVVTEVLAGAMIEKLVETAYNYIANKVKDRLTRSSMNAELDKLKKDSPKIQAVLSAAEKVGVTLDEMDRGLTAWMWQLRDAVDAADNLLDDIEYQELDKQSESEDDNTGLTEKGKKRRYTDFISKYTMKIKRALIDDPILVRLREVVKELDGVAARVGDFVQLVALSEQCASRDNKRAEIARDRETGFLPTEKILFGRVEEKEELTKWLSSSRSGEESKSESSVSILAIVGVGGIGKTSLAQHLYNDKNVEEYFSKRIWICVSNTFDVSIILGQIVRSSEQSLSILQEEVKKELSPERFLLVLDDVWDDKKTDCWKKLVVPLQYGKSGSKIILTTRMDSVAKMARVVMEGSEYRPHNLKGLDMETSALLLDKHAFVGFNRADYSQLQPVIMDVAEKLGGVPLLIKAVGGVLNGNLELGHWRHILNSNAMNLTMDDKKVLNVLKLSYQNLPTKVQSCFRFCSIFPEDYRYTEEELVGMWVALGMIPQSQNGYEQPEDVGKDYFNILVRKSFLIIVNREFDDGRKRYVMHDCMHQMACIVSKGECLGMNNINLKEIAETIRHLFIKSKDVSVLADMCPPRNLQTLIMEEFDWNEEFPPTLNKFFKRLINLRVLKLHWSKMDDLSVVNADLQHLRYVDIYNDSHTLQLIPNCFRKLYHLQVIYLALPGIENAFAGEHNPIYSELTMHGAFFKLLKLRHFYIRDPNKRSWWLSPFFPGIGRLKLLQEIGIFTLKDEDGYKLNELTNMNNLNSSLKITGLESVKNYEEAKEARLTDKKRLYSLTLEWMSNGSPIGDNSRSESDAQLANFLEPPSNLNELTIQGYAGLRPPCWLEIGYPKYLVSLSFIDCDGMSQLPHLRCFRFLKFIRLLNLPLLMQMPPVPLCLEKLKIEGVGLVSLPTFWLDSESTSLIASSSLSSLVISNCPNLRSLAEGLFQQQNMMTALEELEITKCKELVSFPDAGLIGLISLKSLQIQFNQSPSMPDNLLPPSLNKLIISGQVEGVFHNLLSGLTSLSFLHLIELNVTSLSQENYSLKLATLEDLKIEKCGNLKSLDDLYVAASLQQLAIEACSKLEVVALQIENDQGSSSALRKLNIEACDELKSVENLYGLISLKNICIAHCPNLSSVNRYLKSDDNQGIMLSISNNNSSAKNRSEIRELRDLESLRFTNCADLASWSFIIGLKSVYQLYISKCPKLLVGEAQEEKPVTKAEREFSKDEDNTLSVTNLVVDCASLLHCHPLRNLTSVQQLRIFGDLQLHPLAEFFLLQNRTSLREIVQYDCPHLEFLPACLRDLTVLQMLCIWNAKKLKSLPELPRSLQYLQIYGCTSEFERLYRKNTGENWSKIAYISNVCITQDQW
ncbi:hypothetical protein LUZ60_003483 [Juncus effusus]|nr:hypothetical protein LUZ60_003483 [Juncus effusus]